MGGMGVVFSLFFIGFQYYFNVFMVFHCIFDHYVQYHSTQSSLNSHSD